MTLVRILAAILMVTVLPMTVGTIFLPLKEKGARLLFAWIFGQIFLWCGFLFVCVPMVLLNQDFTQVGRAYGLFCGAFFLLSCLLLFVRRKEIFPLHRKDGTKQGKDRLSILLWCVFGAFLLVQLICVFTLMYEDGDDAFYVAITTYSKELKTLYRNIPYTGAYTGLDARHSLAPFPVWVAVFAEVAGQSGAVTAHILMPILILLMTYGLYYLLGEELLGRSEGDGGWRMPAYMCFAALLVTFGGYSIYSAENFLIVRAGQGKAVLANVIIPALLCLTAILMSRLEQKKKIPWTLYLILGAVMTAGCLCSTLGSFLLCVFFGVAALCALIAYRRWTLIAGTFCTVLVPLAMMALYVALG